MWIASTVTIVVLLFGYHTSTNRTATMNGGAGAGTGHQSSTNSSGSSGGSPPDDQSSGHGSGSSTGTRGSTSKGSSTKKSVVGDVASTRWGPVQVKIVVKHHKITAVKMVRQPDGNPRDYQINSYALPILIHETISAQSAHIDMISGATITSGGYIQSLQSALDQAGI